MKNVISKLNLEELNSLHEHVKGIQNILDDATKEKQMKDKMKSKQDKLDSLVHSNGQLRKTIASSNKSQTPNQSLYISHNRSPKDIQVVGNSTKNTKTSNKKIVYKESKK